MTALAQAALSRSDLAEEKRLPFHLIVDEFQNFTTSGFSLILSEARKYALGLTLAHQYLDQLPDSLRDAVFGNVGSMVAYRTGAADTSEIARQIDLPNPAALRGLSNFAAWASVLTDGVPSEAFRLDPFDPPLAQHKRFRRLQQHSMLRFGRDRRQIEDRIAAFYRA